MPNLQSNRGLDYICFKMLFAFNDFEWRFLEQTAFFKMADEIPRDLAALRELKSPHDLWFRYMVLQSLGKSHHPLNTVVNLDPGWTSAWIAGSSYLTDYTWNKAYRLQLNTLRPWQNVNYASLGIDE